MSSDDAYASFLDKANEDPNAGRARPADKEPKATAQSKFSANAKQVPQKLVTAAKDRFYTSEADEPFVPVCFGLGKATSLPNEDEFISITDSEHSADSITILDPVDWDKQGSYKPLIDELQEASKGNDVRVYRVQVDSTRVEYWLVSTVDGNLLGYKAKAIES
ncbi:hypothetical protein SCUCBS95973_007711 [Sporothrix curviconia]|uniref:Uncharacterized protein n=1 Tax=Sporothrix curviconia TaxID=1260050 RepID=A0ABP0CFV8_9PEZI